MLRLSRSENWLYVRLRSVTRIGFSELSLHGFIQGAVRERFEALRTGVIKVLASVEALIDFGEGEEIEEGVFGQGTVLLSFDQHWHY